MNALKIVLICLTSTLMATAQTVPPAQRALRRARSLSRPAEAKAAPQAATQARAREEKSVDKRDPFLSPVREGGPGGPSCTVGKKCLAIDSVLLRGIVEAPSGAIAVVESSVRKATYFLRVNDPVFNGYVMKITPDSIVFRENVMDRLGKVTTRDVIKTVNAPPV